MKDIILLLSLVGNLGCFLYWAKGHRDQVQSIKTTLEARLTALEAAFKSKPNG